ncbi:hypothetical protein AB0L41_40895 [Amycolatopsis mediterranei]|uniref:RNA polymerase sigma factor n=1 Tax=Amycolatopsis mediterranei TaxID=33910 RepID=UPI003414A595
MTPRDEFEIFLRENFTKFLAYELQLCRYNKHLAVELVQKVSIKLWRLWQAEGSKAKRHAYPALYTEFVDDFRSKSRKAEVPLFESNLGTCDYQEDFIPDIDEEVRRAVRELPPSEHRVVFLKYYVGLTKARQIAEVLATSR